MFIGGSDVDVILPDSAYPKVTQSESMEWGGPNNTWVVNYNDSRTSSGCFGGLSYSTDNGATWHAGQPLCSGHGTNFGDPIVVYNARLGMWFAGDLATGCGGQGIGLWTSTNGVTWTTGACAHSGTNDDRESMWVDNNPASPFYGRMYISYNDFAISGGALYVVYSDNGTTWTPSQVNPGFIRNIQVTGDLQGSGRVYVAAMNEGGGGLTHPAERNVPLDRRRRQLDQHQRRPELPGAGACDLQPANATLPACSATVSPSGGTWAGASRRLAVTWSASTYAACGQLGRGLQRRDRSRQRLLHPLDRRRTQLGHAAQAEHRYRHGHAVAALAGCDTDRHAIRRLVRWARSERRSRPELRGRLVSSPCYRRWGRVSFDNGATWQPDDMVGRALSGLPAQPDGAMRAEYEGDYDYSSANGVTAIGAWTDGRNIIGGNAQQDVFVNLVQGPSPTASPTPTASATASPTPTSTPTPTPCVGQYVITQIAGSIVPGTTGYRQSHR